MYEVFSTNITWENYVAVHMELSFTRSYEFVFHTVVLLLKTEQFILKLGKCLMILQLCG